MIFRSTILALVFAAPAWSQEPAASQALQLTTSVTVNAEVVRLGDLFQGELSHPEKIVAQAPAPGQRFVLQAEWLAGLARNLGLDWRPTGAFDRAMVYRPGQTISGGEILAAVRAELQAQGMAANLGLKAAVTLTPVTIAAASPRQIAIREAFYDAAAGTFSAVAEIPAGDPAAQYVPVKGTAAVLVQVPVLAKNGGRNTVITADMLTMADVAETEITRDTIVHTQALVGMTPRGYLRAGQPIREQDVIKISMVDIPVLRRDTRRGDEITADNIVWTAIDAEEVTDDIITDQAQIIGKTPRRMQSSGSAIRRGDLQVSRKMEIAVAARDLRRGTAVDAADVQWVMVAEGDVNGHVLQASDEFEGKLTTHTIRAGQTLRPIDFATQKVVAKGKAVTVLYATAEMQLTARGIAMQDGGIGDIIKITNTKSNTPVLAEVLNADQVRVTSTQTAMR